MIIFNVSIALGGQLVTSNSFPATGKTKISYFIKKPETPTIPLEKDDFSFMRNIIYGDLSHQQLESLVTYVEHVRKQT
jgi:hypothetical protein